MREGDKSEISFVTQASPQSFFASEVAQFSACGVFVHDLANGGWFLF